MKERLLKALQDYEEREFGETSHNSIEDIKNIIPIAYTTVGDDEQYEIQVNFNLEKLQWEEYINGELKHTDKRNSIESFISELESCEFDDIIRDIYAIAYLNGLCEERHKEVIEQYENDPMVHEGWAQQDLIDSYRRER